MKLDFIDFRKWTYWDFLVTGNVSVLIWKVSYYDIVLSELLSYSVSEGGEGMMDNNCIQYRVTGGGGGTGQAGESSGSSNGSMTYRVVNSSEGETSSPSRTSISSTNSGLSNVQVRPGVATSQQAPLTLYVEGRTGQPNQWTVLRDWKPK